MKQYYRCWAEIDLGALRENLAALRNQVGPAVKILTVVKADAYGHGLKQIAAWLMQSGTDIFGVANLSEAEAICSVGKGWPILMLGACLPPERERAVELGVMPTISAIDEAQSFSEIAIRRGTLARAHLKVDTGMGRLGARLAESAELISAVQRLRGIELHGIYTHYASVESDAEFTLRQKCQFQELLRHLEVAGVRVPFIHCNSSGGILCEPETHFNLVRPGLLVYGIAPPGPRVTACDLLQRIRPVLSFHCRVSFIKEVAAGARLSYGGCFTAKRPMRVATVTAGYGDGYPRASSDRAEVLIGARRCRVIGRITMDQMLIDISESATVRNGDLVTLIGRQGHSQISATDVAEWADTVAWEILTGITYRVPRVYLGGQAA